MCVCVCVCVCVHVCVCVCVKVHMWRGEKSKRNLVLLGSRSKDTPYQPHSQALSKTSLGMRLTLYSTSSTPDDLYTAKNTRYTNIDLSIFYSP